jgi:hypothetical protein
MVQVEKRISSKESFGQNRTTERQIQMKMSEFIDKVSTKQDEGELLYLSTQQYESPESEDRNDPFQTPTRQLVTAKKIPTTLPWAGNLCLESCNLWMGLSEDGSSSGLHHDYHDNFYILIQGRKQFRMFSPDTAQLMDTYGYIEKIHFNGVISYKGSEVRPDGLPLYDKSEAACENNDSDGSNVEEEEVVVGKGFDYQSSDEDDNDVDFNEDGEDDFDKIMGDEESEEDNRPGDYPGAGNEIARPNSFSRINLDDSKENEDLQKCTEVVVDLLPGNVLYLPAGFFHCVTSFSNTGGVSGASDSNTTSAAASTTLRPHRAINYWYHPPDQLDSFQNPYSRPEDFKIPSKTF